jgi:hypothetical protein
VTVFKGGSLSAAGNRTGLGSSFAGLADYLAKGPKDAPRVEEPAGRRGAKDRRRWRLRDPFSTTQCRRGTAQPSMKPF